MSWLGGVFTRAAGDRRCQDELDSATPVNAEPFDDDFNDLAEGINQTIPADGSKAFTGALDMGNQDITNVNQITGGVTFDNTVIFDVIGPNGISDVGTIISEGSGCTLTGIYIFDAPVVFNNPTQFNDKLTASELVVSSSPPANASATGVTGTIQWDSSHMYVCVATNTWKRTALTTW